MTFTLSPDANGILPDRMIAAMAKTGRAFAVNWPLAWYPSHRTAKRIVDEGTIGEVIEDEAHARIARDGGLQYGQGYYFGRPAADISGFELPRPVALAGDKPRSGRGGD